MKTKDACLVEVWDKLIKNIKCCKNQSESTRYLNLIFYSAGVCGDNVPLGDDLYNNRHLPHG